MKKQQASGPGSARERRVENRGHSPPEGRAPEPKELEDIRAWLQSVRFRKTMFGGVKEADVWKKIDELNGLYENALVAERLRYDALLEERIKAAAQQLLRQMRQGTAERPPGARPNANPDPAAQMDADLKNAFMGANHGEEEP